jgi:hypothetical protein
MKLIQSAYKVDYNKSKKRKIVLQVRILLFKMKKRYYTIKYVKPLMIHFNYRPATQ